MPNSAPFDKMYMQYACSLALRAAGQTGTNPMVGAVVVRNGRIIGQGFHRKIGEAHAEVVALTQAGQLASGADLYVNLEPCCTHGYTPPCVDAIIKAGIRRVFIAEKDPNAQVNGRSVRILREHRIEVIDLALPMKQINRPYRKYITTNIPYVVVKIAMARDMKISGFRSRYVTAEPSLRYVHALRSSACAVLVGIDTVLSDDPWLTDRLVGRRSPARIIIDPHLRIPISAHVLEPGVRRIVIAAADSDPARITDLQARGVELMRMEGHDYPTSVLLKRIGALKIGSVLVEGGGKTFDRFLHEETYDELYVFVAPVTVDAGIELRSVRKFIESEEPENIGEDMLYHVYRNN